MVCPYEQCWKVNPHESCGLVSFCPGSHQISVLCVECKGEQELNLVPLVGSSRILWRWQVFPPPRMWKDCLPLLHLSCPLTLHRQKKRRALFEKGKTVAPVWQCLHYITAEIDTGHSYFQKNEFQSQMFLSNEKKLNLETKLIFFPVHLWKGLADGIPCLYGWIFIPLKPKMQISASEGEREKNQLHLRLGLTWEAPHMTAFLPQMKCPVWAMGCRQRQQTWKQQERYGNHCWLTSRKSRWKQSA